ncbi:MAG: response regulator transcription factor [Lachnospiraceae bacterium]|nr:response regulator transcription factor [Lachnospiraceae bacterium]
MKILIIDDDKLVSLSLKTILEADDRIEVVGIGSSGNEAITLYDDKQPDILLMDIRMEGMSGLDAGRQILSTHPEAKILFLTTFSDDEYIVKALHIGAKGYLLKQNFESILPALLAVLEGQTVFGGEITGKLPKLLHEETKSPDFSHFNLTEKEMEIIEQVAEGRNNKEIAEALFLSEGTVRNYLSTILEKLNLRDRTQLAVFYYRELK